MNIKELLSNRIVIAFLIIAVIAVIVGVFVVRQSATGVVGEGLIPMCSKTPSKNAFAQLVWQMNCGENIISKTKAYVNWYNQRNTRSSP